MDRNIISKRNVLLSTTKKTLFYILKNKHKIMSIEELIVGLKLEYKKVLQILFVLKGIGFLVFVDAYSFIFPGSISSIQTYLKFVRKRIDSYEVVNKKDKKVYVDPNNKTKFELPVLREDNSLNDIIINNQPFDTNDLDYLADFIRQLIFEILFDTSKLNRQNHSKTRCRVVSR